MIFFWVPEDDELSSSTVSILEHGGFTIGYLDGSGVMGDYIRDDFAIGGVTVKGMTLAVATQVKDIGTGVMGIGFESDESIAAQGGQPYRNLVSHMVGQGLIKSRSYSLWLNDISTFPSRTCETKQEQRLHRNHLLSFFPPQKTRKRRKERKHKHKY